MIKWKKRYPEFYDSIKKGKDPADAKVARSLFERACGYSHPAVKIFLIKDDEGNNVPYRVPYVEHHPPDTAAAFIWLKNRQPELWRDKKDVEFTGKNGGPIQVQLITSRVIDADYIDITDAAVSESVSESIVASESIEAPVGDETERRVGADNSLTIVTIHYWKRRYPEFLSSLNKGKDQADAKVARSLFERACGSSHPAVKIFLVKDEEGNNVPYRVPYVEHYPPDTAAAFIWLKNRQPELWRDRKDVTLTGANGGPIQVQQITSRVIDADYTDITDAVTESVSEAVEASVGDETERRSRADNAPRLPSAVTTKAI